MSVEPAVPANIAAGQQQQPATASSPSVSPPRATNPETFKSLTTIPSAEQLSPTTKLDVQLRKVSFDTVDTAPIDFETPDTTAISSDQTEEEKAEEEDPVSEPEIETPEPSSKPEYIARPSWIATENISVQDELIVDRATGFENTIAEEELEAEFEAVQDHEAEGEEGRREEQDIDEDETEDQGESDEQQEESAEAEFDADKIEGTEEEDMGHYQSEDEDSEFERRRECYAEPGDEDYDSPEGPEDEDAYGVDDGHAVERYQACDNYGTHRKADANGNKNMNGEIYLFSHEQNDDLDDEVTDYSSSDSSNDQEVSDSVLEEMEKFLSDFKTIGKQYRLINKIGEGTFSTVYKAQDLYYDRYENPWDNGEEEDLAPPSKRLKVHAGTEGYNRKKIHRKRSKYVAIKKIYVTSSPARILNELELLHTLKGCEDVVPLITALRHKDQVVIILPYFKHVDFRHYFRTLTIPGVKSYFRSLFTALAHVHAHNIIHRDIKPTNFLYDVSKGKGVLVDFGLAEREGTDSSYCPCQTPPHLRRGEYRLSPNSPLLNLGQPPPQLSTGYIKNDPRPSRRANRAGTRGFRAPEVLFKCTNQTTRIDIWSAGVILLIMLSRRFPFFNSSDDVDAIIEIATIYGKARMRACAQLHGCIFETNLPSIGERGFTLEKIILWATNRAHLPKGSQLVEGEGEAIDFLTGCMELDPNKRLTAMEALEHPFLAEDYGSAMGNGSGNEEGEGDGGYEDEEEEREGEYADDYQEEE